MLTRRRSASSKPQKRRNPAVAGLRGNTDQKPSTDRTPADTAHQNEPAEPVSEPQETLDGDEEPGTKRKSSIVLLSAAVSVTAIAAVLLGFAANAAGSGAAENTAFVDSPETTELTRSTQQTVEEVFSYDHAKGKTPESRLRSLLTEKAVRQHKNLFGKVINELGDQKLTLRTKVQSVGVKSMHDGRAQLLVFAHQVVQRAGTNERKAGGAQLQLSAQQLDDTWKITNIRLL